MPPSAIDLTTLAAVKAWIPGPVTSENVAVDNVLQACITAASLDVLRRTGRGSQNRQVPAASPFNQPVIFTETYDGNGGNRLYLRNSPIISVQSCSVGGYSIDGDGKSLVVPGAGYCLPTFASFGCSRGSSSRGGFPVGTQNVTVTYTAGYAAQVVTGELRTIPALPATWSAGTQYATGAQIFDGTNVQVAQIIGTALVASSGQTAPTWNTTLGGVVMDGAVLAWKNAGPPYSLTAAILPWLSDAGIAYFSSGLPLTQVYNAPATGQYYIVSPGVYLFSAADSGQQVRLSYTAAGTPPDLGLAVCKMIFLTYKRRGWEGLRSTSHKDIGTTTYAAWEISPEVQQVLDNYTRQAWV